MEEGKGGTDRHQWYLRIWCLPVPLGPRAYIVRRNIFDPHLASLWGEKWHFWAQTLTMMVTEAFSTNREIQEVPSCARIRKGLGLSLVWLPGVWAVVEDGETMYRKMIKDLLGSSQILVECFPGSTNTSKLVIKLACKIKKLESERPPAEFRQIRTTE